MPTICRVRPVTICIWIIFCSIPSLAQIKLEKNIAGLNIDFIGLHLSYETRIKDKISVRSEAGLNYSIQYGYEFMLPFISVQPRWYYNLDKRGKLNKRGKRGAKSKNTRGNSGNFIALYTIYFPASSLLEKNIQSNHSFGFLPAWGIRRQFWEKFSFEFILGYFIGGENTDSNALERFYPIKLSVGYNFKWQKP